MTDQFDPTKNPYDFLGNDAGNDKLNSFVRPAPSIKKVSVPPRIKTEFTPPSTPEEFEQFINERSEPEPTYDPIEDHVPKMVVFGDEQSTKEAGLTTKEPAVRASVSIPVGKSAATHFTPPTPGPGNNPDNPLKTFFRSPEAYVTVPTGGRFNNPGEITLNATGQVGIYPMTAKDELMLRTPDALLNGSALEHLIQSCVPAISNVRMLASPDFDILMLGIRMISYGKILTYTVECPHCKKAEQKAEVDISDIMETIVPVTEKVMNLSNGLKLTIKPYTFDDTIKQSVVTFEEAALIRSVSTEEISDNEKYLRLNESMGRIAATSRSLYANAIVSVETPDGVVTNKAYIEEFLENISKRDFENIEKAIGELNRGGFQREVTVPCSNAKCKKDIPLTVNFDPSNFFVNSF